MNDLLVELQRQNIDVSVDGDKLKLDIPHGQNVDALLKKVQSNKDELLAFVKNRAAKSIPIAPDREYYDLSSAQKRLYFLHEFNSETLAYNVPIAIRIKGELDLDKLTEAIRSLVDRHEILRTRFDMFNGLPKQIISESIEIPIEIVNIDEAQVEEMVESFYQSFDLKNGPLIRVKIGEVSSVEHVMLVDMHHIIADATSLEVFKRDLMHFYSNEPLPELIVQYKDVVEWQQSDVQQELLENQKDFWIKEFQTIPVSNLPLDFPRPAVKSFEGANLNFQITGQKFELLKKIARDNGLTVFMFTLAIYKIFLSKICNNEDVTIGTPVAGRNHKDLKDSIGMFINSLVIRSFPKAEITIADYLQELKEKFFTCLENQNYQYDDLVDELKIERSASKNPLYDARFVFQNFEKTENELADLTMEVIDKQKQEAQFDLSLIVREEKDLLFCDFNYSTELFEKTTIKKFIQYFNATLDGVLENSSTRIGDIDILLKEEKDLLNTFNSTSVDYPAGRTILDYFVSQVAQTPDRAAVVSGGSSLSYAALEERSSQLSSLLRGYTGTVVGLYVRPSVDMLVGLLGIMKSGKAFLPLDPSDQSRRQERILTTSGCDLVVSSEPLSFDYTGELLLLSDLEEGLASDEPIEVSPESSAYVIYTSGSSGTPKGVEVSHGNLVNYCCWLRDYLSMDATTVSLLTSSYSFDLGYSSLFPPLLSGGSVHLISDSIYRSPDDLLSYISAQGVSYLKLTPSLFSTFKESSLLTGGGLSSLRQLLLGGEPIRTADLEYFHSLYPEVELINHYGPTETTIGAVAHKVTDVSEFCQGPVIGRPISNTRVYVLDRHQQMVPIGVTGELYIGGSGVSKGYRDSSEQSARHFVKIAYDEGVVYKTGDLGRWLPDGRLVFEGRQDAQLKIRGYRVETGEIQSHLISHPGVSDCVVIGRLSEGVPTLLAYYVGEGSSATASEDLKAYLLDRLPDYMVPVHYICIDSIPLTSNGKVDHKSLPAPDESGTGGYVAPGNEREALLASVWGEVLGLSKVGIHDNFFAVGGDSIKSIQINARMRSKGYKMSVHDIFTSQTISELAPKMEELHGSSSEQGLITGTSGLTPIQKAYFEKAQTDDYHYNQPVMLHFPSGLSKSAAEKIFSYLQRHHDALRMVFRKESGVYIRENKGEMPLHLEEHDLGDLEESAVDSALLSHSLRIQSTKNLSEGPLLKLGLFHRGGSTRLLVVLHHLVVDGVSWRILFEDLDALYRQHVSGLAYQLPAKTDSFLSWSDRLSSYRSSDRFKAASTYWEAQLEQPFIKLTPDHEGAVDRLSGIDRYSFRLSKSQTRQLLTTAHEAFNTQINDLLLAALLLTFRRLYSSEGSVKVELEVHGREDLGQGEDISRTVGWFATLYPVLLSSSGEGLSTLIKEVKETLRSVPHHGLDYLLHRYQDSDHPVGLAQEEELSQISFAYLGEFQKEIERESFHLTGGAKAEEQETLNKTRDYDWAITGMVPDGSLLMFLRYSRNQYDSSIISRFMDTFESSLLQLIEYCEHYSEGARLTPSDLTMTTLPMSVLDRLQSAYELEDVYPLSPMQEGMLFHALMESGTAQYFGQKTYRIKGKLNVEAVESSLNDLISRHTILRTIFLHDFYDRPLQVVLRAREIDFEYLDLRESVGTLTREALISRERSADKARAFDLSKDVLMRMKVLRLGEEEYVLIWSRHHILMDGWCMKILLEDFNHCYQGHITGSPTPLPLAKPYSHYISWLEERADEDSKAYWEKYLQGFDEMTGLPKRQHFDSNDTVFGWERELIIIDQDRVKQLDKIARQYNLTQNSIFTTIWAVLLSKLCNSDNVLFGSVVSGRPPELLNVDQMVGLFINTIPLRIQLDESDTFIDLIEKTQQNSLECKDHQYNSISEFYSMTELGWDLFDHVLVFQNYPRFSRNNLKDHLVREGEFQVEDEKGITQNNYDLWLNIIPGDQIKVNFEYNAAIYEPSQMAAIAAYFDQLMEQLLSDVKQPLNRINLIGKDQSLLLESFNQTLQPISRDKTYFQLFQEQATKDPNRVAVSHNGTSLTYSELLAQANKLARVLIQHGLKSGDRVGVLMPRGIDMLTSILAILRCRLVYVPVDVNYPSGRIEDILNDSEVKILLTSKAHDKHFEYTNNEFTKVYLDNLEDQTSTLLSINDGESQDLAYIIYTSGTTGKPKGVMIHQFGMINHLHAKISDLGISKNDVIAQTASPSFDISIWQFLAALLVGGKTVIIDREIVLDSNQLVKELQDHEISILESVPSLISAFLEGIDHNQNFTLESLRWMIPTGEQLYGSLVRKWYTKFPDIKLLNAYGPTEASDDVTHYVVPYPFEGKGNVPIGKPIQNMHVYIMDDHQNLCPPLIPGKICVSGIGVGQGYWKDPDKTSESFVKNSLANGNSDFTRLYITGDIGYYLPDGNIICLGRQDEQIKIRGNRVELSEIQTCFSAIDGVKESAIAMKDIIGSAELIAYYIADNELAYKAVKNQLAAKLPEYMIPAHIIRLEKFPLTTNGKLDKKSLPLPTITKSAAHQGPKNDTQQRLCEIWGQILGIDPDAIGIDQNFFELGGQSLRAINFLNSLEKEFETRIFLAEFFESPTISSVAEHIMISSITEESKNSENKITL